MMNLKVLMKMYLVQYMLQAILILEVLKKKKFILQMIMKKILQNWRVFLKRKKMIFKYYSKVITIMQALSKEIMVRKRINIKEYLVFPG